MGGGSRKDRLTAIRNISTRDAMYNMINIINTVVWSGRSSGEGNGSLGNIMDRGAWQGSMGVTKEFNTA